MNVGNIDRVEDTRCQINAAEEVAEDDGNGIVGVEREKPVTSVDELHHSFLHGVRVLVQLFQEDECVLVFTNGATEQTHQLLLRTRRFLPERLNGFL
jgi:hypothetical protein